MAKMERYYSMIANCEEDNDFEEIVAWVNAIKGIVGGKKAYYHDKDMQMELTRFENWRYNRFIKKHYPKRYY